MSEGSFQFQASMLSWLPVLHPNNVHEDGFCQEPPSACTPEDLEVPFQPDLRLQPVAVGGRPAQTPATPSESDREASCFRPLETPGCFLSTITVEIPLGQLSSCSQILLPTPTPSRKTHVCPPPWEY